MSDRPPWLTATPPHAATPFASVLPRVDVPAHATPWSQREGTAPAETAPLSRGPDLAAELAAARADAVAAGRKDGLAELEAERAAVTAVRTALERSVTDRTEALARMVADTAIAVVETWLGADARLRRDVLFSIVVRWLSAAGHPPVTVVVHPSYLDAARTAIGSTVVIEPDATLGLDAIRVRRGDSELEHRLVDAIAGLRDQLAATFAAKVEA